MKADAVVIGGGAAGMLCAAVAAERGRDVVLLEPNRMLGRKLRITGKGRCNVTNDCDPKTVIENIPGDGRFLQSALHRFPPSRTKELFEGLGVPLKTERGNRIFPVSDSSGDIADALIRYLKRGGVRVVHSPAKSIRANDSGVCAVLTAEGEIECEAAVICTGGLSYPATGSKGDGYRMAQSLGHTVAPLRPSLVPLESPDGYCAGLQGFSLRNVELSAYEDDRLIYKSLGEMIFTHFGVSGPLVLSSSAHMRDFENKKYRLSIDLKPGLDEKKLDMRLLRDFEKYRNREFKNALSDLAGHAMIPVLISLSGIPEDTRVNEITRAQRQELLSLFKAFPVKISGPRPIAEAIITSGGVSTKEVDPRTMGSKLVPGLFFTGEVLDLDAYTGGFNLQIAWSTGFVAGNSI
ncbi:MAG: NAD(P)/FAD-dependent oxidoreductase [Clostridia bacterium]|nr:NAD(P)/FAD-dependent oxidoreductase [Clostridia bacterium]